MSMYSLFLFFLRFLNYQREQSYVEKHVLKSIVAGHTPHSICMTSSKNIYDKPNPSELLSTFGQFFKGSWLLPTQHIFSWKQWRILIAFNKFLTTNLSFFYPNHLQNSRFKIGAECVRPLHIPSPLFLKCHFNSLNRLINLNVHINTIFPIQLSFTSALSYVVQETQQATKIIFCPLNASAMP